MRLTMIRLVKNSNQKGFTLVELMVVVAIIGILAAIAIPNFKTYQAKAKTTEAKTQLAAIYTAEQAFMTDYDNYATCLQSMGYNPTNEVASRYYAMGFSSDSTAQNLIVRNLGGACPDGQNFFPAGKVAQGQPLITAASNLPTSTVPDAVNFTAGAAGNITDAGSSDQWTINQDKFVQHVQVGY